jgi:hypothetical protein
MKMDKGRWFNAPDSLTESEDGKSEYYNVEGRFADHPVLNPEKSRIARHNVYDIGIILHTRVKKAAGDVAAQRNMSPVPIRFDKGDKLGMEDFERAKRAISRFREAWDHYQSFRRSPVTAPEQLALRQISEVPSSATGKVMVDMGGKLVPYRLDGADEADPDGGNAAESDVAAPEAEQPSILPMRETIIERPAERGRRGRRTA